jgi:hypothetical protein
MKLYRSLARLARVIRDTKSLPSPNNSPTGYSFQGLSTALRTGPMILTIIPPPCIGRSSSSPDTVFPLCRRFLSLIA